jgi:putative transposase
LFGTHVTKTNALGTLVIAALPREHWQRIRHSNFIGRTFGETARRVKVIGRLPGEHSCLALVWAVLDRASASWRGFTMTSAGLRLPQDQRRALLAAPASSSHRRHPTHPALNRPRLSVPSW